MGDIVQVIRVVAGASKPHGASLDAKANLGFSVYFGKVVIGMLRGAIGSANRTRAVVEFLSGGWFFVITTAGEGLVPALVIFGIIDVKAQRPDAIFGFGANLGSALGVIY